jgi:hypothetical protein
MGDPGGCQVAVIKHITLSGAYVVSTQLIGSSSGGVSRGDERNAGENSLDALVALPTARDLLRDEF